MKLSAAYRLAASILHGFDEYRSRFKQITRDARRRFAEAAWLEAQQAAATRINLYDKKVGETLARLERSFAVEELTHCENWREAKQHYTELIAQRLDFELAETYFNSLFCSVFHHRHIRDEWMFVYSSRERAAHRSGIELTRRRRVAGDWQGALAWALEDAPLDTPFDDSQRDARLGSGFLVENLPAALRDADDAEIELIQSVFYRNKGAYLVGRLHGAGEQVPLVLPILHEERHEESQEKRDDDGARLRLDTVIIEPDEVSIIFSFTRVYFQVDVPVPREFVAYLQKLMVDKPE
ncbi:MAG TPA: isocitrate dehydrogenase kinase/phosphatase AceK regulatory subunit, partial [Modicisalibacter sp.]|nr:isocitrate dehydrogenase kinase/phosphatase AceK regulatory subunit [Modicisalibacter sp.]